MENVKHLRLGNNMIKTSILKVALITAFPIHIKQYINPYLMKTLFLFYKQQKKRVQKWHHKQENF
jgi:hypothetical protein